MSERKFPLFWLDEIWPEFLVRISEDRRKRLVEMCKWWVSEGVCEDDFKYAVKRVLEKTGGIQTPEYYAKKTVDLARRRKDSGNYEKYYVRSVSETLRDYDAYKRFGNPKK